MKNVKQFKREFYASSISIDELIEQVINETVDAVLLEVSQLEVRANINFNQTSPNTCWVNTLIDKDKLIEVGKKIKSTLS